MYLTSFQFTSYPTFIKGYTTVSDATITCENGIKIILFFKRYWFIWHDGKRACLNKWGQVFTSTEWMTSAWTVSLTAPLSFHWLTRICSCSCETEGSDQIWSPRQIKSTFVPLSEPILLLMATASPHWLRSWKMFAGSRNAQTWTLSWNNHSCFHEKLLPCPPNFPLPPPTWCSCKPSKYDCVSNNEAAEQIWKNEVPCSHFILFLLVLDGSAAFHHQLSSLKCR